MGQNIVSILHFAAPPIIGGVESTIFRHARGLHDKGYRIQILAGRGEQFHPDIEYIHIDLLDSRHPAVIQLGEQLAAGKVTSEFFRLRDEIRSLIAPYLEKSIFTMAHNVTSLHKNLAFTAALYEFALDGKPIIAWCHDFAWQDELYTPDLHPGYPWELLAVPWPTTYYVVVSQARQQKLSQLLCMPMKQIRVIPPGIDPVEFWEISPTTNKLAERLGLYSRRPVGLLPARITRRKNIEYAIEIIGALKDFCPDACLLITGPPGAHNPTNQAYLASLKEKRSALSLDLDVIFLYEQAGAEKTLRISDKMMAELYRISDFLLFPSRREGFGIPILEAGLSRMPVFAAEIAPVRESSGGNAQLFDLTHHEPTAVANQIAKYLLANPEYLLRKRVLSNYTWQSIIDQKILPFFQEINPS